MSVSSISTDWSIQSISINWSDLPIFINLSIDKWVPIFIDGLLPALNHSNPEYGTLIVLFNFAILLFYFFFISIVAPRRMDLRSMAVLVGHAK